MQRGVNELGNLSSTLNNEVMLDPSHPLPVGLTEESNQQIASAKSNLA